MGSVIFFALPKNAPAAVARYESTKTVEAVIQPATEQVATPTPVAEVQPATTTQVVEKEHPKGCENYVALVSQYDWNVTVAINVMRAESGCNPSAVGDNRVIGGIYAPSCGLMQIRTLTGRPDCESLKDPATNIAWAYKLYSGGGWKHWSVCKTKVSCY